MALGRACLQVEGDSEPGARDFLVLHGESGEEEAAEEAAAAAPSGARPRGPRPAVRLAVAALLAACLAAAWAGAAFGRRPEPAGAAVARAGGAAVPDEDSAAWSLLSLWYSGGVHALDQKVLDRLWKVERLLVDLDVCPPASPEVEHLRRGPWPRKNAGKAPKLSKFMYINLEWDYVRRLYMEDQFRELEPIWERHGQTLEWSRVPGVDKSAFEGGEEFASWRARGFSQAESPDVRGDWAVAGCAYSHYSAIRQIPAGPGSELVVITEDDIEISRHFLELWESLWPYVPEEWDVLRIGWFGDHQNCTQVINLMVDRAGWQDPRNGECAYCGAQAYIVNPASKQRVLERFERSRITHADELLGAPTPELEDPRLVPPLRAFVVWPMLAEVRLDVKGHPTFRSDRVEGEAAVRGRMPFPKRTPEGQLADLRSLQLGGKSLADSKAPSKFVKGPEEDALKGRNVQSVHNEVKPVQKLRADKPKPRKAAPPAAVKPALDAEAATLPRSLLVALEKAMQDDPLSAPLPTLAPLPSPPLGLAVPAPLPAATLPPSAMPSLEVLEAEAGQGTHGGGDKKSKKDLEQVGALLAVIARQMPSV